MFGWVGDVTEPLHNLQSSLAELEALRSVSGPINIPALISGTATPVALLSAVKACASELHRVVESWETASDQLWDEAELDTADLCDELNWDQASTILCGLSADRRGISLAADLLKYRAAVAARNLTPFADAATSKEVPADLIDDLYEQIGRASCRERVCQYVYNPVVAFSLKKK